MGIRIAELEIFISDNTPAVRQNLQGLNRDLQQLPQATGSATSGTEALDRSLGSTGRNTSLLSSRLEAMARILESAASQMREQTAAATSSAAATEAMGRSAAQANQALDSSVIAQRTSALQAETVATEAATQAQTRYGMSLRQLSGVRSILSGSGQTLPLLGAIGGEFAGGPMGGMVGGIVGQLGSNLLGGIGAVVGQAASLVGNAVGAAVDGVKTLVGGAVGVLGGMFGSIGETVGNATKGIAGFFGEVAKGALTIGLAYVGIKALSSAMSEIAEVVVGFSADVERNAKAWEAMLHSSTLANDTLFAIQQNAVATSYSFQQVERGVRQLIQGGFNLGQVLGQNGLLKDVQDVSSSMGSHMLLAFDHLTLALGQIRQAGHLTGEEMRQLRNAGVSIPEVFETMSQQTGKTVGQLMVMQREGRVTSEMFLTAFHTWAQANFGGLAVAQAQTFSGAMEQIRESITLLGSRAFDPLFQRMSALAQRIAAFATSPEGAQWAARIAAALEVVLQGVERLATGFQAGLSRILGIVSGVGQLIYQGLQWLNPFARHSPSLVESVEEGVQRILDAYANLGRELPTTLGPLAESMERFRESVNPGLERIDRALFAEQAKDLALISPGAPAAYREAQEGIRALKEEAAALSPEITAQKQIVREATDAWREWDAQVKDLTFTLKDQEQALKPYDDQISKIKQNILAIDVELAEANRTWRELNATLQPLRDNLTAANDALELADLKLRTAQISLREGEAGLRSYKTALSEATENVNRLQDRLTISRDALSGVNDELRTAKDNLRDVLGTPLQGTAEFREKISQAKQQVAELNAQYLTMKAAGASPTSLQHEQRLLDLARARLEALNAQKEAQITLPEERLRDLAQGGAKEISYDVKLQGVTQAQAQLAPLEAAQLAAQARVDQDTAALHAAQRIVTARKEELNTQERLLEPRRKVVELAQAEREAALEVKDAAEHTLKLEERRVLGPINQVIAGLKEQRTIAEENLKFVELERAQKSEEFQETRDFLEYAKSQREEAAEARDKAKNDLADLVSAQSSLVQLAEAWQRELDAAAQKAKSMAAELKREAKADVGEGMGVENRAGGADQLGVRAQREALAAEFEKSKTEFSAWVTSFQASLNEQMPGLNSFLGRVRGFASGMADTFDHLFNHDVPGAIATFKGTLQDVGEGLPAQMAIWGHEFAAWVIPAAQELADNLTEFTTNLSQWIADQAPDYENGLKFWIDKFTDWATQVWTPLFKILGTQLGKPLSDWVGEKARDLTQWVLENWVDPFVTWVFDGEKGAWAMLRPKLIDLIWELNRLITGKQESDPLTQAGQGIGSKIAQGLADVVGTVAHEMWSALMDAMGKWVHDHKADISRWLMNPLLELGKIMGEIIGRGIWSAIVDGMNQGRTGTGGMPATTMVIPVTIGTPTATPTTRPSSVPDTSLPHNPILPGMTPVPTATPLPTTPTPTAADLLDPLVDEERADRGGVLNARANWRGFARELDIGSPSKVYQRLGGQSAEGFNQGLQSGLQNVPSIVEQYLAGYSPGAQAWFKQGFGASVNRMSELDQQKLDALEAARRAAATAQQQAVIAADPGKQAMWGGTSNPSYVPEVFLSPTGAPLPFDDGRDRYGRRPTTAEPRRAETQEEHTDVVIYNYGTIIGPEELERSTNERWVRELRNQGALG